MTWQGDEERKLKGDRGKGNKEANGGEERKINEEVRRGNHRRKGHVRKPRGKEMRRPIGWSKMTEVCQHGGQRRKYL